MKFEAAHVVEPLEYDFRPYVDVHGSIDEPMDAAINKFSVAWRKEIIAAAKEVGGDPEAIAKMSQTEYLETLEKIDPEKTQATIRRQAELFSQLCGGRPSPAQLMHLPPRVRLRFFRWLNDEVLNPEVETGAGNAQVINLKSSAAG